MPRRFQGRNRNDHFEHDDRTNNHSNNPRRVSFKTGVNKGKNNYRNLNNAAKLLLDDDIDMGASGTQGPNYNRGFRGRGGRLNSPVPRGGNFGKKKFIAGALPWYQIIIPYGAKHERDVIIKALLSFISPDVFIPHYFKINGNAAVFYIDDAKLAEKLFYADRKITMPNGFKLAVIVRNAAPNITIDAEMKEKMKLAMAKRYNVATKALDLTKFHADPDLVDIFCALFRPAIMLAAIDIISENIPDLEALNLNDNKLHGIDHLKILPTKLKNLKILYIGDNRIPYLGSFDIMKSLPLVELYLKGNPLVNRFNDHDNYVSDVRRKFPKLVKLDGVELPPVIGFDVTEDLPLPTARESFLVDPAGKDLVRNFLTQYYAIYDSDSRESLLEAYHENATMSMSASYLTTENRNTQGKRLNAYMPNSRNILRITDKDSRRRYLRTNKLQVVSFLSDLPKTTHDLMGCSVDLCVYTPTMVMLTISGVFLEKDTNGSPERHRAFHRTFVVVPNPRGGFCILNDILYITNCNADQEKNAFSSGAVPPVAQAPEPQAPIAAVAPPIAAEDQQKATLQFMLSQQTGMNSEWSMNCLQETGWDLQRALFIFNQLQSEGKIPPQAFVKN